MSEETAKKKIPLSTFIPGYIIEAKLGEGGMGAVYKARQLSLNRPVAIKILSEKLNKDPQYVARFQREAKIAGTLNHKNIVSVLEAGVSHHRYYYVMEYVEGSSLHRILHKRKTLSEQEAIKIIEEVAEALEHADKYKIVHRDIKPENIMITKNGHAKLCDMGIAKQTQGELAKTLTATGDVFGTPYYISPEQLEGEKHLDIRSDIYSLGVTLYEMVTGRLPFTGETASEVASKRLTKEPIPPKKWNPRISKNLNNLILRMIARKREHRYANSTQLIKSIQRFIQGGHITAPPKPYTKWIAIAAGALIAVITITIFLTGGGKKEAELFNDAITNVEKSLSEHKYSDAIKLLNTFKAEGEETKNRIKEYADKINASAREGLNALITHSNSLFAKCDFDNAINVLVNAKWLYEVTDSNDNLVAAITEVSKKVEERKAKANNLLLLADSKKDMPKDYAEAITDYDKAIELNPNLGWQAYYNRGNTKELLISYKAEMEREYNLEGYKSVIADYDKAIELNPQYTSAYESRGKARYIYGNYKGAIEDYDKVIEQLPNRKAPICKERGAAKSNFGDYKGAIADWTVWIERERGIEPILQALVDYANAIIINPNDAEAYFEIGCYKSMYWGYCKGVIADLDKAISINPNYAEAYYRRGLIKSGNDRYYKNTRVDAIADFDKAIELNPYNGRAYHSRGTIKEYLGDYKGALADFDKAININSNDAELYIDRSDVKQEIGDTKGAIDDLKKSIKIDPDFAITNLEVKIATLEDTRDYEDIIKYSDMLIGINPNSEKAYISRGVAKWNLGDKKGAIEDYNKAISINPNFAEAYCNRGGAKIGLGDYKGAIEDCNKAISINPNLAEAYWSRGFAKYNLSHNEGAVTDWERAIELNPSFKSQLQPYIDKAKANINGK